jgi:type IV pilus assembly protein PilM
MSAAAARSSFLRVHPPSIGVEVTADRVTVVSVERDARGVVVAGHATETLPPGAVLPGLNAANVQEPNAAGEALRRALERAGARGHRAALIIPDAVARVSLVGFETVPARAEDLDQLIRWQARKSVPFPIETAQVSWTPGARRDTGHEFIVTMARRDLIEEYEALATRAGLYPGIVDLATFNLVNAVLAEPAPGGGPWTADLGAGAAAPSSDWLLVNLTRGDATLAIIRGSDLIFFRNRTTAGDETLEDLVHQTAMYHEDRLGGGRFARVIVAGMAAVAGQEAEASRRQIEGRMGVPLERIDPRGVATLRDRISAGPDLLEALAAPLGVLVREEVA